MDPVQNRLRELYAMKAQLEDRGMGLVGGTSNDIWQRFRRTMKEEYGVSDMKEAGRIYRTLLDPDNKNYDKIFAKEYLKYKKPKAVKKPKAAKKPKVVGMKISDLDFRDHRAICRRKGGVPKMTCTQLDKKRRITAKDIEKYLANKK